MTRRAATAMLCAGALSWASASQARDVAFVACPIVQDTSNVPCWLSEHGGEVYYLGIQSDVSAAFNPPSLGHLALVEGTVSEGERICGGLVLEPVKVSIMPALSPECDELRMVQPGLELPFEPPRPPGPSSGRLAFAPPPPAPPPTPPFEAKTFEIFFPFEGTVDFKTPDALQAVLAYARAVGEVRLQVRAQRAAVRLSDGQVIAEREGIAAVRAREIGRMFAALGEGIAQVEVASSDVPQLGDWRQRKVEITVTPCDEAGRPGC
ncbi:MAG: hypothetical protein B7Z08_08365 [Sphingomonadales bacterium 32-68-7]|nr:MAG: hypothetical protein B7Z33_10155 [Sphingomonadales bacterium 12-68-11]OYX08719.1 MAG: hypothetical protein B7Z08_08365 [Sphingomonadales bacterium 32-68-7]